MPTNWGSTSGRFGEEQGAWERSPLGKLLRVVGTPNRASVGMLSQFLPEEVQQQLPQGDTYMGDVFRAIFDNDPTQDSLKEKLGYGAAGFLGDTVMDPLTYLGVGLPLKAVKGAGAGVKAARPLLSVANPVTNKALLRLTPKVADEAAAGLGRTLRSGHALERGTEQFARLPGFRAPKVKELAAGMARRVDKASTQLMNAFGVDIGVDPGVARHYRGFMSKLIGARSDAVRETVNDWMPDFQAMALEVQRVWGHDPETSARTLQKVWLDNMATDMDTLLDSAGARVRNSPTEMATLGADAQLQLRELTERGLSQQTIQVQPHGPATQAGTLPMKLPKQITTMRENYTMNHQRAANAVLKNLGVPATWGGPEAFFDSPLVRQLRMDRRKYRLQAREWKDMSSQAQDRFVHGMWSDPNVSYVPGMVSDRLSRVAKDKKEEVWKTVSQQSNKAGIGVDTIHESLGRFRHLNDRVMQQLLNHPEVASDKGAVKIFQREMLDNKGYPYLRDGFVEKMRALYGKDDDLDRLLLTSTRKMGPEEINKQIFDNGWWFNIGDKKHQLIEPGEIEQAFITDPLAIMAGRSADAKRQLISKDFFEEMKTGGHAFLPADPKRPFDVPDGWNQVSNIPELDGYYFHPDAARWMNNMSATEQNLPHHLQKFMDMYTPALQWWKAWTLSIFPAYHSRNFVGAMWNWYVHGGDTVKAMDSMKDVTKWWHKRTVRGDKTTTLVQGIDPALLPKGTTSDMNSIMKAARKEGILDNVSFVSKPGLREQSIQEAIYEYDRFGDPEDLIRNLFSRSGKNPLQDLRRAMKGAGNSWLTPRSTNKFVTTGFKAAGAVDNNVRMSTLLQRLKMGESWDDAINWVKKTQYDYHDLAPFERQFMANAFPFYAWSRKNIPAQLEAIIKNPDRIARMHSAMQGFEGSNQPEEEVFLNGWMKENFPLRIKQGKDGKHRYFTMRNWLPLVDIGEVMNIQDMALDQATPFAKIPAELMFNINAFTRYKIDRLIDNPIEGLQGKGERTEFFGQRIPNYWQHIMRSNRLVNTLHDIVDNPQELEVTEMLTKTLVGRLYPFQPDRGLREFQYDVENWRKEGTRSIRSAQRTEASKEEQERLLARMTEQMMRERKDRGIQ